MVYGLNRYGITVDNAVALVAALYSIFTQTELSTDPGYVRSKLWYERLSDWIQEYLPVIRTVVYIAAAIVTVLVAVFCPASIPVMLAVAAKAAICGFVIGGAIGGIVAGVTGGSVWEGILNGAAEGMIDGFALAIVTFGIGAAVRSIASAVRSANAVKAAPSVARASTTAAQETAVQPAKPAHGNSLKCTKRTELYELRDIDTKELIKIGETTRGKARYTKKFYRENNVDMFPIAEGTKAEMRALERAMLIDYKKTFGKLPELNKTFH